MKSPLSASQFVEWALREFAALLHVPAAHLDASQIDILSQLPTIDDLADYLSGFVEGETSYSDARKFATQYFEKKALLGQSHAATPPHSQPHESPSSPARLTRPDSFFALNSHDTHGEEEDEQEEVLSFHTAEDAAEVGEMVSIKRRTVNLNQARKKKPVVKRTSCSCNATEHKFLWNCIECGKIMCDSEGPGPCTFCGAPSRDDKREKAVWSAYEAIPGYSEAKALVQKLVEFDREAAKRTEVKDMETDFYAEKQNPWATEEQREWASLQDLQSRQKLREGTTFDFVGGVVKETNLQGQFELAQQKNLEDFLSREIREERASNPVQEAQSIPRNYVLMSGDKADAAGRPTLQNPGASGGLERNWETVPLRNDRTAGIVRETYLGLRELESTRAQQKEKAVWRTDKPEITADVLPARPRRFGRIEDNSFELAGDVDGDQLLDIKNVDDYDSVPPAIGFCSPGYSADTQDQGVCLSLHQPWASLLAYGFKRIEGRVWQTDYRGRLWIHAASKTPEEATIEAMKAYYHNVYKRHPPFPSSYPTSAIIGCVDIIDCIPREQVKENINEGRYSCNGERMISIREENDSPYVFICKAPRVLVVPIQMSGEHKLWSLPRYRIPALQRSLRPVAWGVLDLELEQSVASRPLHPEWIEIPKATLQPHIQRPLKVAIVLKPQIVREKVVCPVANALVVESILDPVKVDQLVSDLRVAVEVEPLYREESANLYRASFGVHFDKTIKAWSPVRDDIDGRPVSEIPPKFVVLFTNVIESLVAANYTSVTSVGGPHVPPLDSLEAIFVSHNGLTSSYSNPLPGRGDPCMIIALSGACTLVVSRGGGKEGVESSTTREALNLIERDGLVSCDIRAGDCLYLASQQMKLDNILHLRVSQDDPVKGLLLLVMRSNLWKE